CGLLSLVSNDCSPPYHVLGTGRYSYPPRPANDGFTRITGAKNPDSGVRPDDSTSAASGNVCPFDDAAEPFVVGVVVAPDDVAADHAGLLLVAGVVGAVEREVPQRGELRLNPVPPGRVRGRVGDLDVAGRRQLPDTLVF